MRLAKHLFVAFLLAGTLSLSEARAEESSTGIERASGEKLSIAVGHYSRARALLIAAVREFDQGYKLANPNVILDSQQWRSSLIDRAQELDHVLDPQPRSSRLGVKYEADTALLNEAKQ
ncbi:MAG: hypothetical protein J0M12_15490 [Deltaproteobacteria bacterium]|nr:hypothetical protein [Deltaproteobacteria bacterium]